jgi:hypothetical protein
MLRSVKQLLLWMHHSKNLLLLLLVPLLQLLVLLLLINTSLLRRVAQAVRCADASCGSVHAAAEVSSSLDLAVFVVRTLLDTAVSAA